VSKNLLAVATKAQMYEAYAAGTFGNRPVYFPTVDSYLQSDFAGFVGIRNRVPGSPFCDCRPHCREATIEKLLRWNRVGLDWSTVTLSEAAPHETQTINAEVMRDHTGLQVHWSNVRKVMREALAECAWLWCGLRAAELLRHHLDAPSHDNLMDLLDRYPDHVIELTVFTRSVGVLGWNTIFWAVRWY